MFTRGSKIQKELIDLWSLRKFQLFAISNIENSSNQTAKLLGGKTLLSSYLFVNVGIFQKRISPNVFWYIGVTVSEITETVILFQYSESVPIYKEKY